VAAALVAAGGVAAYVGLRGAATVVGTPTPAHDVAVPV
jgi:hypothetical protein